MRWILPTILLTLCLSCSSISAKAQSAATFHPGCTGAADPQGPDCTAAIHRYCSRSGRGNAGVLQNFETDATTRKTLAVACFQAMWYGDAPISELRAEHPGCNAPGQAYTSDCVAAIHRWCAKHRAAGGGTAQELGREVIGVACFKTTWYGDISVSDRCVRNSRDMGCIAYTSQFCRARSSDNAGLPQEVGAHVLGVACLVATRFDRLGIPANIDPG
jgi:hypothetical protein